MEMTDEVFTMINVKKNNYLKELKTLKVTLKEHLRIIPTPRERTL